LKIGSGICLVVERDPIILAKEVATLDFLSNGRFLFGIGGGWNEEEMANHGTDFRRRWKVLRERIEAMKVIWRDDNAAYHGETVRFDPLWSWPKPAQKPHPPIYLGGHGPKALDRVVRYCDGWMPIPMRDPASLAVTLYGVPPDADLIRSFIAGGVTRSIFALPSADRDTVLPLLDRYAGVAAALRR
jgi:probable F420-dependent oxidoreductase